MQEYYAECRNGKIIEAEVGLIAVSNMKSATLTVEHIWVKPEHRKQDQEYKLLQMAHDEAEARGLRYLEICVNIHGKQLMNQHRYLINLGFTPTRTKYDELIYEKLI